MTLNVCAHDDEEYEAYRYTYRGSKGRSVTYSVLRVLVGKVTELRIEAFRKFTYGDEEEIEDLERHVQNYVQKPRLLGSSALGGTMSPREDRGPLRLRLRHYPQRMVRWGLAQGRERLSEACFWQGTVDIT